MLEKELFDLVQEIQARRCERQNVELKAAAKGAPEKLYDTLSSFSNRAGGGIIVFGLDEKRDMRLLVFTMLRICRIR